jgi:dTMP kinase
MTDTTPGRFVVFEGLDGAGTTTQLERLAQWLRTRGVVVETTSEPSQGPFGAAIRQAIDGRIELGDAALALAFAADRMDHLQNPANGIEASLGAGRWVLCDRYVLSSLAYQGARLGDLAWVLALNRHARAPDVTVFVDTPVEACLERIARRSAHAELFHDAKRLKRVTSWYQRALAAEAHLGALVTVDGAAAPDVVFESVTSGLGPWLADCGLAPARPDAS